MVKLPADPPMSLGPGPRVATRARPRAGRTQKTRIRSCSKGRAGRTPLFVDVGVNALRRPAARKCPPAGVDSPGGGGGGRGEGHVSALQRPRHGRLKYTDPAPRGADPAPRGVSPAPRGVGPAPRGVRGARGVGYRIPADPGGVASMPLQGAQGRLQGAQGPAAHERV